jgi:hypothetical protein
MADEIYFWEEVQQLKHNSTTYKYVLGSSEYYLPQHVDKPLYTQTQFQTGDV